MLSLKLKFASNGYSGNKIAIRLLLDLSVCSPVSHCMVFQSFKICNNEVSSAATQSQHFLGFFLFRLCWTKAKLFSVCDCACFFLKKKLFTVRAFHLRGKQISYLFSFPSPFQASIHPSLYRKESVIGTVIYFSQIHSVNNIFLIT